MFRAEYSNFSRVSDGLNTRFRTSLLCKCLQDTVRERWEMMMGMS